METIADNVARSGILDVGCRMYDKGFVAANDGNISIRLSDNEILTTPTGCSKGHMSAEQLPIVDPDGNPISGAKASSELPLHLFIYQQRPDVRAVVHAHPAYATGFATAGLALDQCVLAEIIVTIGSVPLAKYGAPSTQELPLSIKPYIHSSDAFLLANHGVVTVGKNLMDAYFKLERVEHAAKIVFIARALGGEQVLPKEAVKKLYELRGTYGLADEHNAGCYTRDEQNPETDCGCEQSLSPEEFEAVVRKVLSAVRK